MKDIILTGPKHSGKTSAGKALALLGLFEFIDIDELILQRTGKTPRELFNCAPEIFKKAEEEAAASLFIANNTNLGGKRRVIAAGGGIIDNPQAVSIIKKSDAKIVFLSISANKAWSRISADGELPPFLQTENACLAACEMSSEEIHRALHEKRAAAYLQIADFIINAEEKTLEEIAAEILKQCQR